MRQITTSLSLLAPFVLTAALAAPGCKVRDSSSGVLDGDVRDAESIHVFGARAGTVMYRKCSAAEWDKLVDRNAQQVYLDDCQTQDGFSDVPVADYHQMLCDSYQFDIKELASAQTALTAATRLYGVWEKQAKEAQSQLDGAGGAGGPADVTTGAQTGQAAKPEDLKAQLAALKIKLDEQKAIMEAAQAKITQHNGAKTTCDKLMTNVILPKPKAKPEDPETPTYSRIYPTSPEYPHLMLPFKQWTQKQNPDQGQQGQAQQGQGQQGGADQASATSVVQKELTVTEIRGQYSRQCTVAGINETYRVLKTWDTHFVNAAKAACTGEFVSYEVAAAKPTNAGCVITFDVTCKPN